MRVFRLGGVYGPRRSLLDAAARAESGAKKSRSRASSSSSSSRFSRAFVARCHVRDVVAILCASVSRAEAAADAPLVRTYNAADDAPAPRAVALAFAEALLAETRGDGATADAACVSGGAEKTTQTDSIGPSANGPEPEPQPLPDGASIARARAKNDRGEKRVRNDRAKTELGVAFAFPTYKEGLAAVADGDPSPFSDATLDVL